MLIPVSDSIEAPTVDQPVAKAAKTGTPHSQEFSLATQPDAQNPREKNTGPFDVSPDKIPVPQRSIGQPDITSLENPVPVALYPEKKKAETPPDSGIPASVIVLSPPQTPKQILNGVDEQQNPGVSPEIPVSGEPGASTVSPLPKPVAPQVGTDVVQRPSALSTTGAAGEPPLPAVKAIPSGANIASDGAVAPPLLPTGGDPQFSDTGLPAVSQRSGSPDGPDTLFSGVAKSGLRRAAPDMPDAGKTDIPDLTPKSGMPAQFLTAPASEIAKVRHVIPPPAPPVFQHIATIITALPDGPVHIRLDPPELGRLTISITHTDTGINARIVADKPDMADFFRRNAEVLSRELNRSGFTQTSLSFSQNDHPSGGPGFQRDDTGEFVEIPEFRQEPQQYVRPVQISGLDIRL